MVVEGIFCKQEINPPYVNFISVILDISKNPFQFLDRTIVIQGETFHYYDISQFEQFAKLPFSIRILLESAVRNCDGNFQMKDSDVLTILNWVKYKGLGSDDEKEYEIPFKPARVIMQDANGVPAGKILNIYKYRKRKTLTNRLL